MERSFKKEVEALRLGATVDLMDDAWWGPSIPLSGGPYFCLAERTLPGCMLVNGAGERFVNEAAPYVDVVHAMYDGHRDKVPHVPSWLIVDQRYRDRYMFAGLGPRQAFPGRWYKVGAVHRAGTVADLAGRIHVPPEALSATVERFNGFARTGHDEDFRRGESVYDRYYGDPRNRPNPCLAPLTKAPFYAVRIVPGITYEGGALPFLGVALVFGLVNAFIRPVLKLLTLPILFLTLGLFALVINGLMLWLTSALATSTFQAVRGSGVAASRASGPSRSQGTGATPASAIRVPAAVRAAATPTWGNDQRFRSIAFR